MPQHQRQETEESAINIVVTGKPNMAISGEYQLINDQQQANLPHFGGSTGHDSSAFGLEAIGIEKQNPKDVQQRLMKMNDIIKDIELEQRQHKTSMNVLIKKDLDEHSQVGNYNMNLGTWEQNSEIRMVQPNTTIHTPVGGIKESSSPHKKYQNATEEQALLQLIAHDQPPKIQ